MPDFGDYTSAQVVKTMVCSESGGGKSGLLATLANSPVVDRMMIYDFDNGLNILKSYLTPEGARKIKFQTFDAFAPDVITKFNSQIKHWKTDKEDLGPVPKFTPRDVVIIDSFSFLGEACRRFAAVKLGKSVQDVAVSKEVWGLAGRYAIEYVQFFAGPQLPCHVVINTHLRFMENERGIDKTYPQTIGTAASREAPKFLNDIWRIDIKSDGKRVLRTQSDGMMMLKSSAPTVLAVEEDFDLGKVFHKILSVAQPSQAA